MVGIQNTADIKLTLTLDKKGLSDLRSAMKTINASLKTQQAVKQFAAMDKSIKSLKKELRAAKSEMTKYKKEQKSVADEAKKGADKQTAALRKVRAERKSAQAQTKASATAEKALGALMLNSSAKMRIYVDRLRQRYGAEKALALVQQQRANRARAGAATIERETKAYNESVAALQKKRAALAAVAPQSQKAIAAQKQIEKLMKTSSAGMQKYVAALVKRVGSERALQMIQKSRLTVTQKSTAAAAAAAAAQAKGLKTTRRVRVEINKTNGDLQKYHMSMSRSADAVKKFTMELKRGQGIISRFAKRLSEAEKAVDALFRASFRLSIVGMTFQRFSSNILRWGGDIMDTFGDFEYTMLRAAGALEIWNTTLLDGEFGYTVLQEKILDLSKEMKLFASNDVAEALYFWGSATGQVVTDVEELETAMHGLDTIMKTSAMTNTEYEGTIKGVYSIITQFYSGDLSRVPEVTEKLFLSTQKTAAEFTDLIGSFKMVGPVAAQVGADFDQINEAMGKLSDLGLRGSLAGRGVRQLFIQMARPSGPAKKKLKELFEDNVEVFGGKTFREVNFPEGEFVGITKYVNNLARATLDLNEADRLQALARISTANSLPMLTALVSEQRNEILGLTVAADKFKDADPAEYFRRNWEALAKSWNASRESLNRLIETVKINLGSVMAEALKPLIDMLKVWGDQIDLWIKAHPEIVKVATEIAAVTAAVSAVLGVVFILAGALLGVLAAVLLLAKAMTGFVGVVFKVSGAIGLFGKVIFDNLGYLYDAGVKIAGNVSKAFDKLAAHAEDVGRSFDGVFAPISAIMEMLLHGVTELVVQISKAIAWLTTFEVTWTAISIILQVVTAVLAGAFVRSLVAAGAAMAILVIESMYLKALYLHGAIMKFAKSVKVATLAVRSLSISMALVGNILGIVVTAGILLYEFFEPFTKLVDGVTAAFTDMNKQVKESSDFFGDAGPAVLKTAKAYADLASNVTAATAETALAEKKHEEILNQYEAAKVKLAEMDVDISQYPLNADERDAYTSALTEQRLEVKRLGDEFYALSKASFQEKLLAATKATIKSTGIQESQINAVTDQYITLKDTMQSLSREAPSAETFGFAASFLADFGSNIPDVERAGEEIVKLFYSKTKGGINKSLDTYMTPQRVQELYESVGEAMGVTPFIWGKLIEKMGVDVGKVEGSGSEALLKKIAEVIEKNYDDPHALALALAEPRDEFIANGVRLSIAEASKSDYFSSEVNTAAANAIITQAQISSEEVAGLVEKSSIATTRLKSALEVFMARSFESALPDSDVIAAGIERFIIDKDYEEAAAAILTETFADGQRIIDNLERAGAYGKDFGALAKALAIAGYGGPELAELMKVETFEDGSAAGEAAAMSLGEAFVEAFNAIPLNIKDELDSIKKAKELGSSVKAANRSIRQALKAVHVGFGRGSNVASRNISRGAFTRATQYAGTRHEKLTGRAERRAGRGDTEGSKTATENARKAGRRTISQLLPEYDTLPKFAKQGIRAFIKMYAADFPGVAEQVIKSGNFGLPPSFIEELFPTPTEQDMENILHDNVFATLPKVLQEFDFKPGSGGGGNVGEGYGTIGGGTTAETNPLFAPVLGIIEDLPSLMAGAAIAGPALSVANTIWSAITTALNTAATGSSEGEDAGTTFNAAMSTAIGTISAPESEAMTTAKASGKALSGQVTNAVAVDIPKPYRARSVSSAYISLATTAAALAIPFVRQSALPIGVALDAGIADGIDSIAGKMMIDNAIKNATKSGEGHSPPKTGPLRHIDKWGENIGMAWSEGVSKGMNRGVESLNNAQAFTAAEITHKGKREVTVKLEVTSPDGTVNRQKQGEMRRGALEALTVAGLEHMVTVG